MKTITVEDDIWEELVKLKLRLKKDTMGESIKYLLNVLKEKKNANN